MLAVSISIPSKATRINAAVADHIPVAELITHLVEQEAEILVGQHWVLSRALGAIRPEHSLAEAGVQPGELLTLEVARVPQPPREAMDELTEPIPQHPAVWIGAGLMALWSWRSEPLFYPLEYHALPFGDGPTHNLLAIVFTACAALAAAAVSLRDERMAYLAAILGFGLGLHINVLTACMLAAVLVWRTGPARVLTVTLAVYAAINFWPGLTIVMALIGLSFAGHIAITVSRITMPRVPAAGVFHDPVTSSAGRVVEVHSSVVVALCIVLCACVFELIPPGSHPDTWTSGLAVALCFIGVSARGTRPIHACSVVAASCFIALWLALHVSWGAIALLGVAIPAVSIRSPLLGRGIDIIEALAFVAAVPLALNTTGVFELIRGMG